MAEIYKDSFLVEGINPDDCFTMAIEKSTNTFPNFVFWKQRPIARLFALKEKDNHFSTINFFLVTKESGVEIEIRFNTRGYEIDQLKSMFDSFKTEMMKSYY